MRAKFIKRALSFLIDANLIFGVIYLVFIIIGRTIIQSGTENFNEHERLYNIELQYTDALLNGVDSSLRDEDISETTHKALVEKYTLEFNERVETYVVTRFLYFFNVTMYFIITFILLNYAYNAVLQGKTFGRKVMGLRLDGNIQWYSLLTRELLYKGFFGLLTLPIDMYLIMFSKSKKAIRDRASGIYVVDESVKYPF